MNREIKFRAWDTVRKKMYSAEEMGQDQETLSPDGRGFINVNSDSTRLSQFHTHLIPLQYTGLKDKNGKEIYEGDIVQKGDGEFPFDKFAVEWDNEKATYINGNVGGDNELWCEGEVEVIGNIYENQELCEVEE